MSSHEKRHTILPSQLWGDKGSHSDTHTVSQDVPGGDGKTSPLGSRPHLQTPDNFPGQEITKSQLKKQNTRFPVKAKPLVSESPSKEKPKYQYHRSYIVDQAGKGVISLKDVEGFPVYLMRELSGPAPRSVNFIQPVIHKNLVSLVDAFSSRQKTFLVYSYEHLAVSLGCAAGAVQFSEADIATICKELLEGLVYLHEVLGVAHGSLDCSNIILTSVGEVKIANIGDSIMGAKQPGNAQRDVKAIGLIVSALADTKFMIDGMVSFSSASEQLSPNARSFVQQSEDHPASELLKHEFLQLSNPGGSWSLKRHYFETFPMGIRIGGRAEPIQS